MSAQNTNDTQRAGTGFMLNPLEAISELERKGYRQNITLRFDHLEVNSGKEKIYPHEFEVDSITRFENTSDPDDQSILYAISSPAHGVKGVFMESYGLYHEEMSPAMLERVRKHIH